MVYRIASSERKFFTRCAEGVLKIQLLTVNLLTLKEKYFSNTLS